MEPPPTGYVLFVAQMTVKMRHERPDKEHRQTEVVQQIGKVWRDRLSDTQRNYYNDTAEQIKREYQLQKMEYRATGSFRPSEKFEKMEDNCRGLSLAFRNYASLDSCCWF